MTDLSVSESGVPTGYEAEIRDYYALMKPRVMSLVIFTALAGMLAAPAGLNPVIGFASILCIAVGAGASGALNMWWEADIDGRMGRTQNRPIPSGRVSRDEALAIGLGLSFISVTMLAVFANPLSALLLAGTIAFYGGFYTMWLKRRTPQNIVIGGAAGAIPPVIGWAVATGSVTLEPLLMFAIIFLWTPPHFWALALWKQREYRNAEVPMLPVTAGPRETRRQIMLYSIALALCSVALIPTAAGGPFYTVIALAANALFVWHGWQVWRRDEEAALAENYRAEKRLFAYSLTYLALVFASFFLDAALASYLAGAA